MADPGTPAAGPRTTAAAAGPALNQHRAADPRRSTWLTANAGSGKTTVLTDRVARLLLGGTRPERILCLTYTKAAATEMQNRLLRRLGEWAMLDDAALTAALGRMGIGAGADLNAARRLFAQAIETPGGLKVQTIHSFCAGVLRRFPLEAGVPHGFAELDDRTGANLRAAVIEQMATDGAPEMADLLSLQSDDRLDGFLAGLRDFDAPPCAADLWADSGLPAGFDEAALLADCFDGTEATLIPALIPLLAASGSSDTKAAAKLREGRWNPAGLAELEILETVLLNGEKAAVPYSAKMGSFPTKALRQTSCAPLMDDLDALMSRVEAARPRRLALAQARRTLALHRFGHAFCARYAAAKRAGGWLDFDDLIARTARLLDSAAMAQWVLFRLDGGIDHILVDEAQDTAPGQWRVIERLAAEFTAGDGAADRPRTLFVVGDPKQSIYSFQGANIQVFSERRNGFANAFAAAGQPMQEEALLHSFRSSPAILSLTDAVFQDAAAQGLGDRPPRHIAYWDDMPGRVDLWSPVPEPEQPEPAEWHRPVDAAAPRSATAVLADAVAASIAAMIDTPIRPRGGGPARPIRPGDVLILVQRRSTIFHELIRALKQAGVPVAGPDRLRLGAELAVRDIRALLSVLATPEDDLSLACALRSPLFGLDEDALFRLAARRGGYLIEALRASGHHAVMAVIEDLQARADFLRPHDLIARLLVRHGGRARLVGRLGIEAEDGIDELLAQALTYETAEAPSLTGFLAWLADDRAEVRRQQGTAADKDAAGVVRVMTAHGAKGLESPVVILPDCAARKRSPQGLPLVLPDSGPPAHWRAAKAQQTETIAAWVARDQQRAAEERRRLLYVAMTRAESWLIVAAAGDTGKDAAASWYAMVEAGFDRPALHRLSEGVAQDGRGLPARRLSCGSWPENGAPDAVPEAPAGPKAPAMATATATPPATATAEAAGSGAMAPDEYRPNAASTALPDWLWHDAPAVPRPLRPVAASALGGGKVVAGDPSADARQRPDALLAGTRLHLLLEHLPGARPETWPALAEALLAGAEQGVPTRAELAGLLDQVAAVVDADTLSEVFAPPPGTHVLREVALTAVLPGGTPLSGVIDRLILSGDTVTAIDYKSNAVVPPDAAGVPQGYQRQMAAYRHALRAIWPGRRIETQILWTASKQLMTLPDALLDQAWQSALADLDPAAGRS